MFYLKSGDYVENSMVIYITIKGERLLALLDTDSTHNFIQGATLQRLGFATSGGDQLQVTVANGDSMPCVGIARGVEVSIAGAPYTITCVDIDLGRFDFILGVDFLAHWVPSPGTLTPGHLSSSVTDARSCGARTRG
jgi:hypothetical protein